MNFQHLSMVRLCPINYAVMEKFMKILKEIIFFKLITLPDPLFEWQLPY